MKDIEEFPWPKKDQKLFVDGGEYLEFAHYGWGGVENHFYGYIEGYKTAADTLIEQAIESGSIKTLDTFVFPILFLYRQFLELEMKSIFISYFEGTIEEKSQMIKNASHDLIKIWDKIKPILLEETSDKEKEDVTTVESYIKQFDEFDKSSFKFRYPITKDLKGVLENEVRLNLSNLKERMNELYGFFNGCSCKLEEIMDFKMEMISEYMDYEADYGIF